MLSPLIRRPRKNRNASSDPRSKERGVTIALVALSMVGIIAMAALSIDVGTLYQAKAEAQRAADAGALAAARVISISGVTGDPGNAAGSWQLACGAAGTATLAAIAVAKGPSNLVAGVPAGTVTVTYGPGAGSTDCNTLATAGSTFSVNPTVTVFVQNTSVPTFFAHIFGLFNSNWNKTSVSATATAEVYNPSGSGTLANGMVPVKPRCVKPWIILNSDPTPGHTTGFVSAMTGGISSPGTFESNDGVIGETFNMQAGCTNNTGPCVPNPALPPPGEQWYYPASVQNASTAVPTCNAEGGWTGSDYQQAIAGCDYTTVYACGTLLGSQVDLTENPVSPSAITGDTATGAACLTNSTVGPDVLTPFTYPFQITAGAGNPLTAQGVTGLITTSNSIATVPICDSNPGATICKTTGAGTQLPVTIIGFLQVFINQVNADGSLNVTAMNVSGCSDTAIAQPVAGSSPVPVRLITPP